MEKMDEHLSRWGEIITVAVVKIYPWEGQIPEVATSRVN